MALSSASTEVERPARKRKEHHKSRWGCQNCKRRHIRCDERKPSCTQCLTRNLDCSFTLIQSVFSRPGQGSGPGGAFRARSGDDGPATIMKRRWPMAFNPVQARSITSNHTDPFEALPLRMDFQSHRVFKYYIDNREDIRRIVGRNEFADYAQNMLVSPNSFAALLMSAAAHLNIRHETEPDMQVLQTFFYQKVQVIRALRASIAAAEKSSTRTSKGTIDSLTSISHLVAMEHYFGDEEQASNTAGFFALVEGERSNPDASAYLFGMSFARHMLLGGAGLTIGRLMRTESSRIVEAIPSVTAIMGTKPSGEQYVTASWIQNHIFSEFLIDPEQVRLRMDGREPMDAQVLRWFLETLRTKEVFVYNTPDLRTYDEPPDGAARQPRERLPDHLRPVLLAVAGIALITASVTPLPDESDIKRLGMRRRLIEIRTWFVYMIERWRKSNTLLSLEISIEVLNRLARMMTPEGQKLVEEIIELGIERRSSLLLKDIVEEVASLRI